MRHCVPCNADYREAPERCPACDGPTLDAEEMAAWSAAREDLTDQSFEVVAILEGPVEMSLFAEVFTAEEIPHIIRAHGGDGLGMIFRPQKGWGVMMVQTPDREQARELVQQIRNSAPVSLPQE